MASRELDFRMAKAKDIRSEALRQIGRRVRSWISLHLVRHVPRRESRYAA